MKPGRNSEIILEGSRDRRYVRKAAKLIGSKELVRHIADRTQKVYGELYSAAHRGVTSADISDARAWGWVLNYQFTEFQTGAGVVSDIAHRQARDGLAGADVSIDPQHTEAVLQGLQTIANMSRGQAVLHLVRRPVAVQMINEFADINP